MTESVINPGLFCMKNFLKVQIICIIYIKEWIIQAVKWLKKNNQNMETL